MLLVGSFLHSHYFGRKIVLSLTTYEIYIFFLLNLPQFVVFCLFLFVFSFELGVEQGRQGKFVVPVPSFSVAYPEGFDAVQC